MGAAAAERGAAGRARPLRDRRGRRGGARPAGSGCEGGRGGAGWGCDAGQGAALRQGAAVDRGVAERRGGARQGVVGEAAAGAGRRGGAGTI